MASLGAMSVEINADTSGLEQGTQRAGSSLNSIGVKAGKIAGKMAALGAAAAAAGAAIGAKLYSNGSKFIDQQAKMARTLDGSIDGLRALQIAASDAGTSENVAADAAQRLNGRLAEAERGTGRAVEALDRLGLSASELQNMDVDERMATLADRMNTLNYSSGQAIDTLRDFGVRNREMALMLIDGGEAIRNARDEVDAFGLSLSEVDAAKVESANDAMSRIGRTMEGVQNAIAIEFAPLVNELSDRFNELSKENDGFGNIATQVAQSVSLGFAKVADIFRGLQVAIKGIEVIVVGVWRVFNNASLQIWESFSQLVDGITGGVNKVIRGMNAIGASVDEIPKMSNSQFMRDARRFDDELGQILADKNLELHELAATEMPSDKIMQFFEDVKKRSQEMAEQVIADRNRIGGGSSGQEGESGTNSGEEDGEKNKELKKRLDSQLKLLRDAGKTRVQLAKDTHQAEIESMKTMLDLGMVNRQEYSELAIQSAERLQERMREIRGKEVEEERGKFEKSFELLKSFTEQQREYTNGVRSEQLEAFNVFADVGFQLAAAAEEKKTKAAKRGADARKNIEKDEGKSKLDTAKGVFGSMSALMNSENKKMFRIGQAAAIANATISTFEGATKALSYGPFIGPPLAAMITAAGMANVASIASQKPNGGGAKSPSTGGGASSSATSSAMSQGQQQEKQTQRTLMVQGDFSPNQLFTGDTVRGLIDAIAEQQKDGYTVVV